MKILRRVSAVIFALLFILSNVITATFCWQNEQIAKNILAGDGNFPTDPIPLRRASVELIKLEKGTEKPIPNTVFTLIDQNGESVGTYTTDENGKIKVSGLTVGEYCFEEISPGAGYTYDTQNGQKITRYYFDVVGIRNEKVVVKAYNIPIEGSLKVTKTVENDDGSPLSDEQLNTEFEFIITFSDNGAYKYRIDGQQEHTLKSGEILKLSHNQAAVFENIPIGVLYNVTEVPYEGYVSFSQGHRSNITAQMSVAQFTNRYTSKQDKKGTLTVTKEVVGQGAELEREFSFTAVIGDKTETFTLTHGQSKTFEGLETGAFYKVSEILDDAHYTPTVNEYSGYIDENEAITLPFVNVYVSSPKDKTGSLVISKEVLGDNIDTEREFTFGVVFIGEDVPEKQVFTLKHGESKTFDGLLHGTAYMVSETDAAGYLSLTDAVSGIIGGDHAAQVTFLNAVPQDEEPSTVSLTVTKRLSGEILEGDEQIEFEFDLYVNSQRTGFTLKADQTKSFEIPVGAAYEVVEKDVYDKGFIQHAQNACGTAESRDIEVIFTNERYTDIPQIKISGEKTWDLMGHTDVVLPDSITVYLKNQDIIVDQRTVVPDEDGKWLYSFTAPKYNSDSTLAVYTVEEEEIFCFTPTYDAYNIKNSYVPTVSVDPPIIRKAIIGTDVPERSFEFVFTGQEGAPMPQGSQGNVKKLYITGEGEVEIGVIHYTRPGVYVYEVTETDNTEQGWTYDDSLYTVTITVTQEDTKLFAYTTIENNAQESEEILFTNTYDNNNIVISGTKTWNHGANPLGSRPKSIVVKVMGDGKLVMQRQVTSEDDWKYSFTLPKFSDDGREIVYTVDETDIPDYKKTINGLDIHNEYTGKRPDIPQTGDENNLFLWFTLMCCFMSAMIMTVSMAKGKRR